MALLPNSSNVIFTFSIYGVLFGRCFPIVASLLDLFVQQTSVINAILDFSKLEAGKVELEIIDFDLHQAIEETIDLVAQKADEQGIELALLTHHEVPALLRGDPSRIRQVL